jgi:amidohydrolase
VATGVGKTGVVGVLDGGEPGSDVLLVRFDMDALPIDEDVDIPFKSKTPGVMHACGHDAHTAVGLGVAEIMARHRDAWKGTIKFVFQPAEEMISGAKAMIADGVLQNPKPTRTLSMHVNSMEPVGKVMMTDGPSMAGGDPLSISIKGRGTHGAAPHLGIDPILAAAHVISALQSIVSRNVDPLKSAVVTLGSIHGGSAGNVIPDEVKLQGTLRTFEAPVRELAMRRIKEIVETVSTAMGCTAELSWGEMRVPATSSDAKYAEMVRQNAKTMRSVSEVDTTQRTMGSEDCSWFLEAAPGAYVNIGAAMHAEGKRMPHHSPRFEISEESLPLAVALLSKTAMDMLKQ